MNSSNKINNFGESEKLYNQALKMMDGERPDISNVINKLNQAIELGSAQAAYALATWYLHGEHVDQDRKLAEELLKFSSGKNFSDACFDYATLLEKEKNLDKAFEMYVKAALYGDADAFYEVGRMYYYGIGCVQNKDLSEVWLNKAQQLGVID